MADATSSSRRRRVPLTKAAIIEAALEIVDREGLSALNMRRLGAQLGVEAMAVYKHFPNKGAILDGIVEVVLGGLPESTLGDEWRRGFRETFLALRASLGVHPNALPLAASRPLASPQLRERLESTRDLLLRSGLPEDDVLHLLHAGISLTVGYLWLEAGGFVGELPDSTPFLRTRPATERPQGADCPLALASPWNREDDFAAGLDLLLADAGREEPGV